MARSMPPKQYHEEEETKEGVEITDATTSTISTNQQQQQQQQPENAKMGTSATSNTDHLPRICSRDDLRALEMLRNPVWIFDAARKSMYWGNRAALVLWSAASLGELLDRDFATDMSQATETRLRENLHRARDAGEEIHDQWTFYPNFGKEGPRTVSTIGSAIQIVERDDDGGEGNQRKKERTALLFEGRYVGKGTSGQSEEVDKLSLRGLETLRHLPISVRQFDMDGNFIEQNPEALKVFGHPSSTQSQSRQQENEEETKSEDPSRDKEESARNNAFLRQFDDIEEGFKVLQKTRDGQEDCQLEAKQRLADGTVGWFSLNVRQVRDPVTSEKVICYSARDVSDIMHRAKAEADRVNMERSEFFAVMAHEIRTPLHQVVGCIELLARTRLCAEQTDFVAMLQTSTHALMAIINDLLDFTKLEAGKMRLESIQFEVRAIVTGCLAAVSKQAEEKGLQLRSNIGQNIPVKLLGDPNRLRQILLNMAQNAVKFTNQPNGQVSINISRANKDDRQGRVVLRFEVQDTGIGIAQDHLHRIFNPYQQADASISRNFGGTGLGLAICDSLVKNMQGQIGVTSEKGKGTTFWFEIPFERQQLLKKQLSSDGLLVGIDPIHGKECGEDEEDMKGLRILVAEDNKVNQKVAAAMLKRLGHHPTIVENGQLAVDEITGNPQQVYDLILMDIQMPVMDGIDATKEIRNKGYPETELPIVALTASIQAVDWEDCGMNDYVKKPVRIAELKQCLAKNVIRRSAMSSSQGSLDSSIILGESLILDRSRNPDKAQSKILVTRPSVLGCSDALMSAVDGSFGDPMDCSSFGERSPVHMAS